MKQFERVQTEGSKRVSRIDIATQEEEVNPMAPSFQDVGQSSSRTRRDDSDEVGASQPRRPTQSSLQPEFVRAAPGQQFGFKLPDAVPQTDSDIRAPTRTRLSTLSSQPSAKASGPPSSRSTSLFPGGSLGTHSTAVTSCPPSACSSTGERRLVRQRDPHSQRARHTAQRTASFYDLPIGGHSGHSLSAAPDVNNLDVSFLSNDTSVCYTNISHLSRSTKPPRVRMRGLRRRPFAEQKVCP